MPPALRPSVSRLWTKRETNMETAVSWPTAPTSPVGTRECTEFTAAFVDFRFYRWPMMVVRVCVCAHFTSCHVSLSFQWCSLRQDPVSGWEGPPSAGHQRRDPHHQGPLQQQRPGLQRHLLPPGWRCLRPRHCGSGHGMRSWQGQTAPPTGWQENQGLKSWDHFSDIYATQALELQ